VLQHAARKLHMSDVLESPHTTNLSLLDSSQVANHVQYKIL